MQPFGRNSGSSTDGAGVLRLIAGEFAEEVAAIWPRRHLRAYVQASDMRRHVWHCWLLGHRPVAGETVRQALSRMSNRELVEDAFGSCPEGLLGVFRRLGSRARNEEFYRCLFRVFQRGGMPAKHLRHADVICDRMVQKLADIQPHHLRHHGLAACLRHSVEPEKIEALLWMVDRIRVPDGGRGLSALGKTANPKKAVQTLMLSMQFPDPPWASLGRLKPVRCASDLARLGRQFNNCLAGGEELIEAVLAVQANQRFYYLLEGDTPILISIERVGSLGWVLDEAKQPRNEILSKEQWQVLKRSLDTNPAILPAGSGHWRYLLFGL